MKEISKDYINEVKDLMELQAVKADEYFSAKRVTKDHSRDLLRYMVKNKIKAIDGIHLAVYKGSPYLKLEKDVFDKIDNTLFSDDV